MMTLVRMNIEAAIANASKMIASAMNTTLFHPFGAGGVKAALRWHAPGPAAPFLTSESSLAPLSISFHETLLRRFEIDCLAVSDDRRCFNGDNGAMICDESAGDDAGDDSAGFCEV